MTKKAKKSKSKFSKGLKKRQEKQMKEASGGSGIFRPDAKFKKWNPNKGDHFMDIIPYYGGKNDSEEAQEDGTYMYTVFVHNQVGVENLSYVCPKSNGLGDKRCPMCEERKRLKDNGEDYEVWKKYVPQKRELYNVVCMDSEKEAEKGVQVLNIANFYMGKFLEPIMQNPVRPGMKEADAYIQFALETEEGKTVGFRVGEKKVDENTYPEYSGHRFVDRDYDVEEFLESAHTLDELIYEPTYKEMWEALYDEPLIDDDNKDDDRPFLSKSKSKRKAVQESDDDDNSDDNNSDDDDNTDEDDNNSDEKTEEKVKENPFSDIDTDEMEAKELKRFIKKNKIPLDDDIGDKLAKYDDEDLRFLVEDWIENQD